MCAAPRLRWNQGAIRTQIIPPVSIRLFLPRLPTQTLCRLTSLALEQPLPLHFILGFKSVCLPIFCPRIFCCSRSCAQRVFVPSTAPLCSAWWPPCRLFASHLRDLSLCLTAIAFSLVILLIKVHPHPACPQSLCSVCSVDCSIVQRIVATMPHPRPAIHTLNPASIQDVIQASTKRGWVSTRLGITSAAGSKRIHAGGNCCGDYAESPWLRHRQANA